MSEIERQLEAAHRDASRATGEIALALAARRGVTRRALHEWATLLRRAADTLEKQR